MEVVIASISYQKMAYDLSISIDELKGLCEACNLTVVDHLHQNLDKVNRETYFNSGKLNELKQMIDQHQVAIAVFNEELSGLQLRNITEYLGCEVLDRTQLILRIFSSRAKTKEAILQVAIANKQYELTHLIGQHEHIYSQQGGSGFRGAGETQLEIDRRDLRRSITSLERELREAVEQRKTQRRQRTKNNIRQVALVGYTNSGKSTLMNQLVMQEAKNVFADDMLFATLETSSRLVVASSYQYILVDTVGFISQLPTALVKAFRSTLEEVSESDLLLHIVDASNPNYQQQLTTTNAVLKELHCEQIPMVYVYNKMDLVQQEALALNFPCVMISAKLDQNLDRLAECIKENLYKRDNYRLFVPFSDYQVYGELKKLSLVVAEEPTDEGVLLDVELAVELKQRYAAYIIKGE